MQDEFDVMTGTVTPSLSFGVQPEPELPAEKKPEEVKPAEPVDDSILSDEEKQQVEEFSKKIDLRNSAGILQYGAGTQQKMADFSEKALERVRTKDLGEVGGLIGGLVGGKVFKKLSMVWLRRVFALLILYGGVKALL